MPKRQCIQREVPKPSHQPQNQSYLTREAQQLKKITLNRQNPEVQDKRSLVLKKLNSRLYLLLQTS